MKHKLLNIEETSYSTRLSVTELKSQIEGLFKKNTLGLSGRLTSNDEFTVYNKMNVVGWSMPHLKRKSAYAYGTFTKTQKGSLLNLIVKPNSILPIFAIVAAIAGIIILLAVFLASEYDTFYIFFGLLLVVFGLVYYPISTYLRNRLRNKIVKILDLTIV